MPDGPHAHGAEIAELRRAITRLEAAAEARDALLAAAASTPVSAIIDFPMRVSGKSQLQLGRVDVASLVVDAVNLVDLETIAVTRALGEGTSFTVALPLRATRESSR